MTYFSIYDDQEPEEMEVNRIVIKKKTPRVTFKLNDTDDERKELSSFRKIMYWICGVEKFINVDRAKLNKANDNNFKIDTSIDQSPLWSNVCDINAIIAMAICSFLYAFFNKFSNY